MKLEVKKSNNPYKDFIQKEKEITKRKPPSDLEKAKKIKQDKTRKMFV